MYISSFNVSIFCFGGTIVIIRIGFLLRKETCRQWKYHSKNKDCDAKQHAFELFSVNTHNNIVPYMLTTSELIKEHVCWLKSDPFGDCTVSLRNYTTTLYLKLFVKWTGT